MSLDKRVQNAEEALVDLSDGARIMVGGFGLSGSIGSERDCMSWLGVEEGNSPSSVTTWAIRGAVWQSCCKMTKLLEPTALSSGVTLISSVQSWRDVLKSS